MSLNKLVQICCIRNRYRTTRSFYHLQPIFRASLSSRWYWNTTHFIN